MSANWTKFAALALALGSSAAFAKSAKHDVHISGMQFNPAKVTANVGDTVVWTNDDLVPHTVTSDSFDSGELDPGKTWSTKVKKAGTINYKCRFHPTMSATLEVK